MAHARMQTARIHACDAVVMPHTCCSHVPIPCCEHAMYVYMNATCTRNGDHICMVCVHCRYNCLGSMLYLHVGGASVQHTRLPPITYAYIHGMYVFHAHVYCIFVIPAQTLGNCGMHHLLQNAICMHAFYTHIVYVYP